MESMIDITQTMACIQCGACVSDCLSMEVDPLFIGPAALAKAYRFVGDPRDGQHKERLKDLAEDPHGIYDCTHCFKCIDACPKGVAPMSQIMRLRRRAGNDHHIVDVNNGERHEAAFTTLVRNNGLLWEAELLPRSYGGNSWFAKFAPPAGKELLSSLPSIIKGLLRRKVTPAAALKPHRIPREDLKAVQAIYDRIEGRDERYELNLYVVGSDEEGAPAVAGSEGATSAPGAGGASDTAESPDAAQRPTERSAPAGESIAASAPPPPDPGPASAVGPEGEAAQQVGPGDADADEAHAEQAAAAPDAGDAPDTTEAPETRQAADTAAAPDAGDAPDTTEAPETSATAEAADPDTATEEGDKQ
jgi:ferredoxin